MALRVSAFTPQDAKRINEQLLSMSEHFVNQVNARALDDSIRFAAGVVKEAELKAKQAALAAANVRLEAQRARLTDPDYLRLLARKDLNLVQPGEQPWLLPDQPAPPPKPAAPPPPPPKHPWYQRLWAHVTGWIH
jgi:capsular polysaccharide transport system permease protein